MDADRVPSGNLDPYRHAGITKKLLDSFFDVYHELGSGFLEAVYSNALAIALTHAGVPFAREVLVPISFRGVAVGTYRADFLIAQEIVVELMASSAIDRTHIARLVNYLRGSRLELGYILNFGPKPSFKRLIMSNARKTPLRPPAVP